ncbi:DNA-binding response regulator [Alicyclobacillus acidoterrestris]|uniref:response regulator transcription factor n=1 Tax=Alicyclobacillus suci TaxID=2816080 RepID=UPI00119594E9|nr:response regulator transcription factor [Alicyclobacillus suci]GEO26668.1 DNA-binding response regulator [Alicyclobacillus acidoterrestris]
MTERTHPPFLVAVVEDDDQLASTLARQLVRYEFEPVLLDCRQDIARAVDDISPHIVLLDINLPKYDGFYWCRRIRESSVAPIIFVSARNAGMDQVFALENGGDDYIVKPFDMDVLVAKLRAQIRRAYGSYANAPDVVRDAVESLAFGPFELNVRKMQVGFQGHWTALTKTEFELLRTLMEAKGAVVSRDLLLTALWDDTTFVDDNTLTVNVTRLRKRLTELGATDVIRTVRGVGYQLVVEESLG